MVKKLIAFRSRKFIACHSNPSVLNNASVLWCTKKSGMRVLMDPSITVRKSTPGWRGWKIACNGGLFFLPHLSRLPHLPGVPHLHVNRPLQFSWNVTPKMGSSVHCGMLLTSGMSWIKPFFRKIRSLRFDGLHIILFSLDQIKNWFTKSVWQWPLLQTRTMSVESSVYLNGVGWLSMLISRSLIKILNKYGPLKLPCVVPLFTHFHCFCYLRNFVLFWNGPFLPISLFVGN